MMKQKKLEFLVYSLLTIAFTGFLLYISLKIQINNRYFDVPDLIFSISLLIIEIVTIRLTVVKIFINPEHEIFSSKMSILVFKILFVLFGVYGLYAVTIRDTRNLKKLINQQYIEYSGTLINSPKNDRIRGLRTTLRINKNPFFRFKFQGLTLSDNESELFNNTIQKGDSVFLIITKNDYNKKLENNVPLNFIDKHFNYHDISIYGLNVNRVQFIDLKERIRKAKVRRYGIGFWVTLPFSIFCIIIGSYLIIKK